MLAHKKLDSVWVEVKIVTYHHDFRCGLRLIHLDPGRIWTWTSTQDQTFSRLTQFLSVSKIPSKSQQGWLSSSYAPPGPAKLCDQAWARWRWDPVSLHWWPLVSIGMIEPACVQTFYWSLLRILIRYRSWAISDIWFEDIILCGFSIYRIYFNISDDQNLNIKVFCSWLSEVPWPAVLVSI